MVCRKCGANLKVWQEVFGEPHSCVTSPVYIRKVLTQLFRKDELTTLELEEQIKGRG